MKAISRLLVLAFLLAVTCVAGGVAAMAADGIPDAQLFANDETMAQYGQRLFSAAPEASDSGVDNKETVASLKGIRTYNIENAPALRVDNRVTIPRVSQYRLTDNTADPANTDNTADPANTGNTADPANTGNTADPANTGNTADPANAAPLNTDNAINPINEQVDFSPAPNTGYESLLPQGATGIMLLLMSAAAYGRKPRDKGI